MLRPDLKNPTGNACPLGGGSSGQGVGRGRQAAPRGEAHVQVVQEGGALRIRARKARPLSRISRQVFRSGRAFRKIRSASKRFSVHRQRYSVPAWTCETPMRPVTERKSVYPVNIGPGAAGGEAARRGPKSSSTAQILALDRDDVGKASLIGSATT